MAKVRVDYGDLIISALTKKLGNERLICPLSQDSEWNVEPSFATVFARTPEAPQLSSPDYFPFAVLSCKGCGYSFFVNLVHLGLAETLGILPNGER